MSKYPYQYRLNQSHRQLLQASLLRGEPMQKAWEAWQDSVDLDAIDNLSYAILPQLYQNLVAQGLESRDLPRLKGIYRRNWYANQLAIKSLKTILLDLAELQIEVIVIGDSADLENCDRCRPISSLQLLVNGDRLDMTLQYLQKSSQEHKWQLIRTNNQFIELRNTNQRSPNLPLYLHSHLFTENFEALALQHLQITNNWQNGAAWQLSPTDRLLHECDRVFFAHQSLYPVKYPQIISIAEAFLTIRHQSIDWTRLFAQAQQYQMVTPVRNMMQTLQNLLLLELSDSVMYELSQIPIAKSEKSKYPVLKGDRLAFIRSRLSPLVKLLRSVVKKIQKIT